MRLSERDLGYIAGIIDGEGCIYIDRFKDKRKTHGRYQHVLRIKVAMTDFIVPLFFYEAFGGSYRRYQYNGESKTQSKDTHIWGIGGDKAKKILELIWPYLKIKRKQAEVGILFETKKQRRNALGKYKPLLSKDYLEREEIYTQFRILNKKGAN